MKRYSCFFKGVGSRPPQVVTLGLEPRALYFGDSPGALRDEAGLNGLILRWHRPVKCPRLKAKGDEVWVGRRQVFVVTSNALDGLNGVLCCP